MSEELAARLMARIAVPPMPFAPDTYTAGRMDQFTEMITQLRALPEVDKEQVLADAHARIEDLHYGDDNLLIGTGYQLAVNDALAALTQPQTEQWHENDEADKAATAAGVADAEHERRLETNRLLWNRVARLEEALRVIRGPEDRGPWMLIYRNAGGGYAGLQAIAETALAPEDSEPSPYAKAFREKFPVPEFPGIEKEES